MNLYKLGSIMKKILNFIAPSACMRGIYVCLCMYEFVYLDMYKGMYLCTYSCIRKYLFLNDSSIHCIDPCVVPLTLIIIWIYRISHLVVVYSRQRSDVCMNWQCLCMSLNCVLTFNLYYYFQKMMYNYILQIHCTRKCLCHIGFPKEQIFSTTIQFN